MSRLRREEDAADKWLREHDSYYADPKKNKRKMVSHPYETPEQERRRRETEIPISSLSSKLRVQFMEVAGAYNEKGEFSL